MVRMRTLLVLSNSSDEPVYRVRIEYRSESGSSMHVDEIGLLPPGRQHRELPASLQETWDKVGGGVGQKRIAF